MPSPALLAAALAVLAVILVAAVWAGPHLLPVVVPALPVVAPPALPIVPPARPVTPPILPVAPPALPVTPPALPITPSAPPALPVAPPFAHLDATVMFYGAGGDPDLYEATPPATGWTRAVALPARLHAVAYNPVDGRVYGVDDNLDLWAVNPKTGAGGVVPGGDPPGDKISAVEFDGAGGLWGVTNSGALVSKGTRLGGAWEVVAEQVGAGVASIAFDAGGVMWGATPAGAILRKATHELSSPWVPVPNTGIAVYGIHIDRSSGWFYGIGGAWQLYGSPDLARVPWSAAPVDPGNTIVQDVAVVPLRSS